MRYSPGAIVLVAVVGVAGDASAEPAAPARPDAALVLTVTLPGPGSPRDEDDMVARTEQWMVAGRNAMIAAALADEADRADEAALARQRARTAWRMAATRPLPAATASPRARARAWLLRMHAHDRLGATADADADADAAAAIVACPACPTAGDAAVRLGERAFARGDLDAAAAWFTAAAELTTAALVVRGYAHYQLAWIAHDRGDDAAAGVHLRRTLAYAATIGPGGQLMARAARRDAAAFAARPAPGPTD